jgi:hypothetical protein
VLVSGSDGAPAGRVFSSAAIRAGLVMARYLARMVSGAVTRIAFTWAITATRARIAVARSATACADIDMTTLSVLFFLCRLRFLWRNQSASSTAPAGRAHFAGSEGAGRRRR